MKRSSLLYVLIFSALSVFMLAGQNVWAQTKVPSSNETTARLIRSDDPISGAWRGQTYWLDGKPTHTYPFTLKLSLDGNKVEGYIKWSSDMATVEGTWNPQSKILSFYYDYEGYRTSVTAKVTGDLMLGKWVSNNQEGKWTAER